MKGYPAVIRFPVLWGDMDALGHVNNARYLTWFETARVNYVHQLGYHMGSHHGWGPVLARTSCEYLKPIVFPADLVAGARVVKVGNTSLHMEHVVALAEAPDDPCARGESVLVLIRYDTLEKVRVPDDLRRAIAAFDGNP